MSEERAVAVSQGNSPAEMIKLAVQGNADLSKLEKLLELQERYEANEAKKAYHKAMAAFKANPPKIDKDKTVSYGNTKYNHATLGNVTEKISAELSKYGLSASWTTKQNGQVCVTCRITHELGHSEETTLCAASDTSGSKNAIQAIGSTITYLERYTLLALTGLATYDQDDDGQAAGKDYISQEQANTILDLLTPFVDKDKNTIPSFCKYLGVDSIEHIFSTDYQKALAAIHAKEAKAKK